MAISDWPEAERPREKLLSKGPQALSDAELLAIFLRTGSKGKTALDLARELLTQFNGLAELLKSDCQSFCQLPGTGVTKYVQIQAALELGRRHLETDLKRSDALTSPSLTRNFLLSSLKGRSYEVFACLFLDNAHRVISFEEMFRGTLSAAHVHPREIVKRALAVNAAAVIFAHNHPSGIAEPSRADIHITQTLIESLALVDIRVLDHMIIGDREVISLAERGLI